MSSIPIRGMKYFISHYDNEAKHGPQHAMFPELGGKVENGSATECQFTRFIGLVVPEIRRYKKYYYYINN